MRKRLAWWLAAVSLAVGACGSPEAAPPLWNQRAQAGLVAFESCEQVLRELREAYATVPTRGAITEGEVGAAPPDGKAAVPQAPAGAERGGGADSADSAEPAPGHSTTNNHEQGVAEPDLVQTDGRRVVTVADGTLRVIDVANRRTTSRVWLPGGAGEELLLFGDRALVVGQGTSITLVELSGQARVLGTLRIEGGYVDARMAGGRARVVVSSTPRLPVPPGEPAFDAATVDDWLPSYELTTPQGSRSGRLVDCDRVSHPDTYTATSFLTVLTFDLTAPLGTGDPVTVAADGGTVYGTARSLYLAHETGYRTEIHRFDLTGAGPAEHVASAAVEGTLLSQYAMSEHDGHLRVATTRRSDNVVTVLAASGSTLTKVGSLAGLGRNEQIYAVRFFGTTGYVVTFRRTDPLYTLDLTDPTDPEVVGELKITGYSAYLHRASDGKLLGVGQEADELGRTTGLQVSLFDVTDAARPRKVAEHELVGGRAQVESQTHAFLYWEPTGLLVLPTDTDALVLRLAGHRFTDLGTIGRGLPVRRALVVGDEVWVVSTSGIGVHDEKTLAELAWLPFEA
ncbi:beta propeller domain-containing protein [Saccharomonospora marina XMU15]|uniref:Beta propeller domain-containing protein n=1 Tax=Saccharomonospora marina XMU15 TaxID=882083 RepID=H5WYD3_9PSEU|nr:beta-propeller domain-containing protein [Saccharomonospora marina]EHR49524.1 beta propeller domain-containing protein [Saccharomonospora marina XMU15]